MKAKKEKAKLRLWVASLEVDLLRKHPYYPKMKSAWTYGIVMASSEKEAEQLFAKGLTESQCRLVNIDEIEEWEQRRILFGIRWDKQSHQLFLEAAETEKTEWISFTGVADDEVDAELQRLAEVAEQTFEPQFTEFLFSPWKTQKPKRIIWVKSLQEAIAFLKRHKLPFKKVLSMEESKTLRERWRKVFAKFEKPTRLHRCPHCRGGDIWSFDWHGLNLFPGVIKVEKLPLDQIKLSEQEVALFFEACNIPIFVIEGQYLQNFEPKFHVDMYLAEMKGLVWTMVYTHEVGFGPYFCRQEDVNG